jgi:hypothetical protein
MFGFLKASAREEDFFVQVRAADQKKTAEI